ncbi:hypothetical protein DFR49_4315 [Hephaestia caeni]|uniref:Uncharacterized protein n=1 Tax=Hephaestia caeni TaxID=645617 RepID=A0A397NLH3_9SPHN|nr:hypothetical protein [Hephaestia caeni]RIA35535.1 hypothetical protein DFR49_4315 [Hephaestia caeni]
MPLYRCFVRGENFPGELVGASQFMGFYTTRWIEAPTAEAAETAGVEMLRAEYRFSEEEKQRAPDARVYFEEVVEVPADTPQIPPNSGATWFEMDSD